MPKHCSNKIMVIVVLALVACVYSAPHPQPDGDLAPSYGDEPPKENARNYWSDHSQDDQVNVQGSQDQNEGQVEDSDNDDNNDDNSTNEVSDSGSLSQANANVDTPAHVIVKRNKRPIRYRSKNQHNRS